MATHQLLIFIPTYNERENVERIQRDLAALDLPCDVLYMDDGSPDGTGAVLDRLAKTYPNVTVIHRPSKQGIGSAHQAGIAYAYAHGYTQLVTMDADFTHSPVDIARLLEAAPRGQVIVASRYHTGDSLPNWNVLRKFLTMLGHVLTRHLLGIPGDASGAFRLYNLTTIQQEIFSRIRSHSYAFFFESLFVLHHNRLSIHEIPIVLPARTYGHSKMSVREAMHSAAFLLRLWSESFADPGRFNVRAKDAEINDTLNDPQNWNAYWTTQGNTSQLIYGTIAAIYRNLVIKNNLERFIKKHFRSGSYLLHAGCGSGQVDTEVNRTMKVTAVDISTEALNIYAQNNPEVFRLQHASIFELPDKNETYDGVYNLGVIEHFTPSEIHKMMVEFNRVLKPDGKVLIFWPHRRATSVFVLNSLHFLFNSVMKKTVRLHPPEVSLLKSRSEAFDVLRECGFQPVDYYFGGRDLFVQAVVVGQKTAQ